MTAQVAQVVSIAAMMKVASVADRTVVAVVIKALGPVAVVTEVALDLAVVTMIDPEAVATEETAKVVGPEEVSGAIGKWAVDDSVAAMNEAIVAVIPADRAAASETTTATTDAKEVVISVISVTSRTNKAVAPDSITEEADTMTIAHNNNRADSVEIVIRTNHVVSAAEAEMTEASAIREASAEAHQEVEEALEAAAVMSNKAHKMNRGTTHRHPQWHLSSRQRHHRLRLRNHCQCLI